MAAHVPPTTPLPPPTAAPPAAPTTIAAGPIIAPVDRITLFSPGEWEDFIREWADALRTRYTSVDRFGGSGDMGCDVVAITPDGAWDNYQCKHYDRPLQPNHAWPELAKLVYYTFTGDLPLPSRYFFVAPHGVGTTLSNRLRRPQQINDLLAEAWPGSAPATLEGDLRAYLSTFDFSIVAPLSIHRVIDDHAKTRWHATRFGGGLPARGVPGPAPHEVADTEAVYVRALLDAYADHVGRPVAGMADIAGHEELEGHFKNARHEFYSAEHLRLYARETTAPDVFEDLQDQVYAGIGDDLRDGSHPSAYRRVLAVIRTARGLALDGHILNTSMRVPDRGGICHQLANDQRVTWAP